MTGVTAPEQLAVSRDRRLLTLRYADGRRHELTAEMLRVLSPSAEVQGHSPEQRVTVAGKSEVAISDIRPIGHYAVRIVFDDGHDSGLFTWSYLDRLGTEKDALWQAHLADLAAKGLLR
ncbi:gamma-butyrobetaine hydroxylase-like domain-containing protein [Aureimonas phyllosphaerae]|uniref:DUF971 family protein n=1 Tax=Aureimonas phyllosphaerae TaxID=1166078 RepID=A0A7W6BP24_9HYPH|nr:DUF971 domain-containing protein [Aureimonas phyllosphaerae]MBB3935481.1 DUF971 family protein [Aureimonas phyllosphaerae]MBB3959489.1 DUF971 family protein [Aureimonas phyllosphaerae]SFF11182.1 DUF971 family protein [Aureimonas phyllosphaerae]